MSKSLLGGIVMVGVVIGVLFLKDWFADHEAVQEASSHFRCSVSQGTFNHDLIFKNVDVTKPNGNPDRTWAIMDFSFTLRVVYEDGQTTEMERMWKYFGPGEEKTITVPSRGRIHLVELRGRFTCLEPDATGKFPSPGSPGRVGGGSTVCRFTYD